MKNLIGILLLAIEFFIHVCEVNSYGGKYAVRPPYQPDKDENVIVLNYMGMDIYVTRKLLSNVHIPIRCTVPEREGYPILHGIPTIGTKRDFNFKTIPLDNPKDGVRYCVLYVTENWLLLGLQVPPTDMISDPKKYKGDPKTLSPDKSKYFLTYLGWDFVVYHKEADSLSLTDVKLFPNNKPNTGYKQIREIKTYHVRVVKIECAGISFFAARKHKKNQTAEAVFDNSLVIFEAAWLHAEDISPLLQEMMTEEQRNAWLSPEFIARRKMEGHFGNLDGSTNDYGKSSKEQPLKKARRIPYGREVNCPPASYVASSSRSPWNPCNLKENNIVIGIMGILIDVTRKSFYDVHIPYICSVRRHKDDPPVLGIPNKKTKGKYNFTTRPVFGEKIRYCVLYLREDRQILGVKVPPDEKDSTPGTYRGNPMYLSPDESKYYITCLGWDFVVYHEVGNLLSLKAVKLYPKNKENNEFYQNAITTHATRVVEMSCVGVKFFAARKHRQNQTGPLVLDDSLVIFEAAWLHAKDIPDVLPKFLTNDQLNAWITFQKNRRTG